MATTIGSPAAKNRDDPSTCSSDYEAMKSGWQLIDDVCAGFEAIKGPRKRDYLPQFVGERDSEYEFRLQCAEWQPEFLDAFRSLAAKPFTKPVMVNEDAPPEIAGEIDPKTNRRVGGFVDDVDGRGNSLHVFARDDTFIPGVKHGLAGIYVTFPAAEPARTRAEEKASGVRPYWVGLKAPNIRALYSKQVGGREVVEHIRLYECTKERDGFDEITVERIRVIELDAGIRPTSRAYRLNPTSNTWELELGPEELVGVSEIPIALFFTGERSGNYRVKPPLLDLAHLQIGLYRAGSVEEQIVTYTGSPMLKMVGMLPSAPTPIYDPRTGLQTGEKPASQMQVGPRTIIWIPPQGDGVKIDADYIASNPGSMEAVHTYVGDKTQNLRRLGMAPMTKNSGTLSATEVSVESARAHSAVEVWAHGCQKTLNQAFKYTSEWLRQADTVTVSIHTDFGVGTTGTEEQKIVGDMQKRKVVSAKTEREEAARRGVLGPSFDEEEEEERLAEEAEGLEPEQPIDPRTGLPIDMPAIPDPADVVPGPRPLE